MYSTSESVVERFPGEAGRSPVCSRNQATACCCTSSAAGEFAKAGDELSQSLLEVFVDQLSLRIEHLGGAAETAKSGSLKNKRSLADTDGLVAHERPYARMSGLNC